MQMDKGQQTLWLVQEAVCPCQMYAGQSDTSRWIFELCTCGTEPEDK